MTHREAAEILPWYANATLSEGEKRAVEEHLAGCAECRQELVEVRATQAAEMALAEDIPAAPPFLMTRAMAQLDRPEPRTGWMRFVLVAQLVVVLCLAAVVYRQRPTSGTLSGPGGPDVRVGIVFDPALPESGLRQILIERGGTIVSGPSASGLYTVAFPVKESDAGALLDALQHTAAIRFAERSK